MCCVILSCKDDVTGDKLNPNSKYESFAKENLSVKGVVFSKNESNYSKSLLLKFDYKNLPENYTLRVGYVPIKGGVPLDTITNYSSLEVASKKKEFSLWSNYFEIDDLYLVPFIRVYELSPKLNTEYPYSNSLLGEYYEYGKKIPLSNGFDEKTIITDVFPLEGFVGDTVTVYGKNFCSLGVDEITGTSLSIGGCPHGVFVESDSVLKSVITEGLIKRIDKPLLKNCGEKITYGKDFILDRHKIDSITSRTLKKSDTLRIYGENFIPLAYSLLIPNTNVPASKVIIGSNNSCNGFPVLSTSTNKRLDVLINSYLKFGESQVKVVQLQDTIVFSQKVKFDGPVVTGVEKEVYAYGDTIRVYGSDLKEIYSGNLKLYVNGISQNLLRVLNDTVAEFKLNNSSGVLIKDKNEIDISIQGNCGVISNKIFDCILQKPQLSADHISLNSYSTIKLSVVNYNTYVYFSIGYADNRSIKYVNSKYLKNISVSPSDIKYVKNGEFSIKIGNQLVGYDEISFLINDPIIFSIEQENTSDLIIDGYNFIRSKTYGEDSTNYSLSINGVKLDQGDYVLKSRTGYRYKFYVLNPEILNNIKSVTLTLDDKTITYDVE
ncbi:hypothetical protein N9901_02090 [Flavobacteriaceae bacterium]|nr:hypothetical protein [Flavobacteriaceae bacterium]